MNFEKGQKVYVRFKDHFNTQAFLEESLHQEQCGFFERENEEYIYISLSRHTYDGGRVQVYEEIIGILKADITHLEKLKVI